MVELRPAYAWDCPECGRELMARAIIAELSEEDLEDLKIDHGIHPWETGNFVEVPDKVTCPHCKITFTADYYGTEDED